METFRGFSSMRALEEKELKDGHDHGTRRIVPVYRRRLLRKVTPKPESTPKVA